MSLSWQVNFAWPPIDALRWAQRARLATGSRQLNLSLAKSSGRIACPFPPTSALDHRPRSCPVWVVVMTSDSHSFVGCMPCR